MPNRPTLRTTASPARRARRFGALAALAACLALPAAAHAASATLLTVDQTAPELTTSDGARSGTLSVTNLTGGALGLSIAAADDACRPTLDRKAVGAQTLSVKLTIPTECDLGDAPLLRLTATTQGSAPTSQTVELTPTIKPEDAGTDWTHLYVFPIAIVLALLAACVAARRVAAERKGPDGFTEQLFSRIELGATYSFKDSWISNVTVAGGALTAIFGSTSVVKALLGKEADATIALATVGSAMAVALIGLGPILLYGCRTRIPEKPGRKNAKPKAPVVKPTFTVLGLVLAMGVSTAGAAAQLYVGWRVGIELDLDGWTPLIHVASAGAAGALILYSWSSLRFTLHEGLDAAAAPEEKPKSDAKEVATLLKALLTELGSERATPERLAILDGVIDPPYPRSARTSRGDDRPTAMP